MSASAQVDALVTMLSAASVFGASMVEVETYSILNFASGSCAVISTIGLEDEPTEFDNGYTRWWTHQIDCFSKDQGDPYATKARNLKMLDTVVSCLEADRTLLGTSDATGRITATHNPNYALVIDGLYWSNPRITIMAQEFT
jgi:hypothetical protein